MSVLIQCYCCWFSNPPPRPFAFVRFEGQLPCCERPTFYRRIPDKAGSCSGHVLVAASVRRPGGATEAIRPHAHHGDAQGHGQGLGCRAHTKTSNHGFRDARAV